MLVSAKERKSGDPGNQMKNLEILVSHTTLGNATSFYCTSHLFLPILDG